MAFSYSGGPNQSALSSLDAKQQQQVQAAFRIKASNPSAALGPGQRAAMTAYKAALGGGAPSGGGGAGGGGAPSGGGAGGGSRWWMNGSKTLSTDDIINDPARLGQALTAAGIPGGSLQEQLKNVMMGYSFAGREQWVQNQTGGRDLVAGSPSLQNVGLDTDINALRRIVGEISGAMQEGRGLDQVRASWAERLAPKAGGPVGVPDWASGVYDTIGSQDLYGSLKGSAQTGSSGTGGWTLEQLASPGINLYDPSQPLFAQGDHPASLQQLTGWQAGEEGFYRGLSPAEFLTGPQQEYNRYYNRAAGAPAPHAGLTFGVDPGLTGLSPFDQGYEPAYWRHPIRSPAWQFALTEPPAGSDGSNRFGIQWPGFATEAYGKGMESLSPSNQLYARWSAFGQPGDPTMNGVFNDFAGPGRKGSFSPLTGQGSFSFGEGPLSGMNQWIDGSIPPGYLAAFEGDSRPWSAMPLEQLQEYNPAWPWAGHMGMAAALGRPDLYWSIPYLAPFGPGGETVDELAYQRLLQVMAQTAEAMGAE